MVSSRRCQLTPRMKKAQLLTKCRQIVTPAVHTVSCRVQKGSMLVCPATAIVRTAGGHAGNGSDVAKFGLFFVEFVCEDQRTFRAEDGVILQILFEDGIRH